MRLGILDEYAKDFHIICLSETKTDAPDLIDTALCDYTCFVKSKSIKKHKFGGIHGLCMLVKENISKHAKLLEENDSKHVLWVYFNKKAFGLSCVFGSVYIPHEASKYYNKELFDELAEDIINIKSKYDAPICLLGDFNSRTGTLDDFTVLEEQISEICNLDNNEIDVFNSKQYFEERGLNTNRSNKDNFTNNNGYKLIELCRCLDLKIVNGRIGSDQNIGDFTCISNQGSSTVDYCIASSEFFPYFDNFSVDVVDKNLSDVHCPISLTFKANHMIDKIANVDISFPSDVDYTPMFTKWDQNLSLSYEKAFNLDSLSQFNDHLDLMSVNGTNDTQLEHTMEIFKDLFLTPSTDLGMTNKINLGFKKSNAKKTKVHKPGFDNECIRKRANFFKVKNRLKKCQNDIDKNRLKLAGKEYRVFIRCKMRNYFKQFHKEIRDLKSNNPKVYWNKLKLNKNKNTFSNISLDCMYEHFKKLNDIPENNDVVFDPRLVTHSINEDINKPFTVLEIESLIKKTKKQ